MTHNKVRARPAQVTGQREGDLSFTNEILEGFAGSCGC